MSASYPSAAKSFTPVVDGVDYPQATQINQAYDEITALEQALVSTGLAHNLFPDASTRTLGTSAKPWGAVYAQGVPRLLYANSGTDTTAAATTVDSIAIAASTLTAKDTLVIEIVCGTTTQGTARPQLYHVTDGAVIQDLLSSGSLNLAAGVNVMGTAKLRQRQTGNTKFTGYFIGKTNAGVVGGADTWNNYTATAAWTAAWTLGLRHGGVTAGGTFDYSWSVHLWPGQ